ncbi:PAS domain-containing protein [Shewanella sedimentimangrovi]|uniref:PAS domain-containing protein n=1 Tax=Shewanella sedimentimangrovi TaxID=2814293 RepID=A0ABX7R6N0_9GAMM|nr:PAS domain-containing protein [Shewanella sedimentimangrovi]QSX38730.1 PAS domain-containing protein [Shewanella sedimentimangrovi]
MATLMLVATIGIVLQVQKDDRRRQELNLNLSYGQLMVAKLTQLTTQINTLTIATAEMAGINRANHALLANTVPHMLNFPGDQRLIAGGGIWPDSTNNNETGGPQLFWARDALGILQPNSGYNSEQQADYHQEIWFAPLRLFPAGRVLWSPAYIDRFSKEAMVTASVPMWQQHAFLGTATVDVSLRGLEQWLLQETEGLGGYLMVFDSFNRLIAAPKGPELSAQQPQELDSLAAEFNPLQSLIADTDSRFIEQEIAGAGPARFDDLPQGVPKKQQALFRALLNASGRQWPRSATLLGTLSMARDPMLDEPAQYSVFLMPDTFWKVVTVTPQSSLREEALLLIGQAGLWLILVQLVALMVLFGAQHKLLIRPLVAMVQALKNNQPATLELVSRSFQDEIGTLASAFVSRTRQLEITMASLDASNLALEQQIEVQKEAQQELLRYRDQLNALLKSTPNLIYIKDTQGRYLLVNDKYCETLGIERPRLLGSTDQQLFARDLANIYRDNDLRVLNQGGAIQVEEPLPTLHGEKRFQMTKFAIADEEGAIQAVGTIAFDIQHRRRAELKLQQEQQLLHSKLQGCELQIKALSSEIQAMEQKKDQLQRQNQVEAGQNRLARWEDTMLKHWLTALVRQLMQRQDTLMSHSFNDPALLKQGVTAQGDQLRLIYRIVGVQQDTKPVLLDEVLSLLQQSQSNRWQQLGIQLTCRYNDDLKLHINPWHLTLLCFCLFELMAEFAKNRSASQWTLECNQQQLQLSCPRLVGLKDNSILSDRENEDNPLQSLTAWFTAVVGGTIIADTQQGLQLLCKLPQSQPE